MTHKYDINRPRSRHEHKYSKCKKFLSMMMLICIKQHLSNIWSSIHEKLGNTETELNKIKILKKACIHLTKKACIHFCKGFRKGFNAEQCI